MVRALISSVSFCREREASFSTIAALDLTEVDLEEQQFFCLQCFGQKFLISDSGLFVEKHHGIMDMGVHFMK